MPELPEVEAARRLAARVAVGRRLVDVWCAADPIVLAGVAPSRVRAALRGRRVRAARRHGKHLWFELDRGPALLMHFGMTGGLHVPGRSSLRLKSTRDGRPPRWPPRFVKLRLTFDDGGELAMADARRLGRIRLREDPRRQPPLVGLGFDALLELPPAVRFYALLHERAAPMKALLLDQTFAAGVGNWIADEVLYQARIDPRRAARTLTVEEAGRLRRRLRAVLTTAVAASADSGRFPRAWLFHRRWDRDPLARTARGDRIRWDTIAGRTTAWVPAVQR
ncbi:MAG TPA: DNA-formamidopyrimidine glycosylase family protein [Methylomirabilota bacterium]|nr:DNA-formamidopyrimidine glycosylase family protein [Methylomirabilota bacterium]